jgi:hypothetical protein
LTVAAAYDFVAPSKEIQWLVSVFTGIIVSLIVSNMNMIMILFTNLSLTYMF